ncbi:zinc finger, CCHC-type containing protein [Tanacetum coccineum]
MIIIRGEAPSDGGPGAAHAKHEALDKFNDDASRYCYVYLLHAKHEALDKFKIYKQEVELQRQDLIKVLRTDRGGEYYDPVYFQSTRIIHQSTAPYTPQQKGVAERKNRTLKEMVKGRTGSITIFDFCDHFYTTKIEVFVIMTIGESVKEMTSKFDKLAKFEGHDFHR